MTFTDEELKAEVWRAVFGREKAYEVSDLGRVRSIARLKSDGHILAQCLTDRGYARSNLGRTHQLVAKAFLKPPQMAKMEINHIDGNKLNNRATNLEWITHLENIRHAARLGLLKPCSGERNPGSKLTEIDVLKIRQLRSTISIPALARMFSVSRTLIWNIDHRIAWAHI